MPQIVLSMTSDSPTLNSIGDIFKAPVHLGDQPEVTDVFARNHRAARFHLDPGDYEYRFYVQDGEGKFTIGVRLIDQDTPFVAPAFDGKYTRGLIVRFSVPGRGGNK